MDYEAITIIRASAPIGTDHGNPIPGPDTETPVARCLFAPASTSEPFETGRAAVITKDTVYAPPGTVILPSDRILIRGIEHIVDGEPGDWSGGPGGVVVAVKRVEG